MASTEQVVFVNSAVIVRKNDKYGAGNLSQAGVHRFKTTKNKLPQSCKWVDFLFKFRIE